MRAISRAPPHRAAPSGRRWFWSASLALILLPWAGRGRSLLITGARPTRVLPKHADLARELERSLVGVANTWIEEHRASELEWSWGEGVLVFGLERAFQQSQARALREYVRAYLRRHLTQGVHVDFSDAATPAIAAMERVLDGDGEFAGLAQEVVDYARSGPKTASGMFVHLGTHYPGPVRALFAEVWVDSLFHLVPVLMRYGRWRGDTQAREQGVEQTLAFLHALTDPTTGLVTHAYDDAPRGLRLPPFEHGVFWARGNGWMLATLVDVLALLPDDHLRRAELLGAARGLEARLRACQAASGLFHTLLLDPESYQETAGSALIVYAMARGLRLGLFPAATEAAVLRGARGLWSVVREANGRERVTGTSLGTNPHESLYLWVPTAEQVSYGVGAWLLAASEVCALLADGAGP